MPGALFNPATLDTNPYDKTQYNMGEAVQTGLKSADLQIEREGKERATAALPKYLDAKEQANVTSQQMADILTHFPGVVSAKNEIAKLDAATADTKNKHMKDALASMLIAGVAAEKQGQDPVQATNDMAEHFTSQGVDMSQFKGVPDWSKRVTLMKSLLGNYDDLKSQVSGYDTKTLQGMAIPQNVLGDALKPIALPKQPESKGVLLTNPDGMPKVVIQDIKGVGKAAFQQRQMPDGTIVPEPLMKKEVPNPAQAKPEGKTWVKAVNEAGEYRRFEVSSGQALPPGWQDVDSTGSAFERKDVSRMNGAGSEVVQAIENTDKFSGTRIGVFSNLSKGTTLTKSWTAWFGNKATDEEAQMVKAGLAGAAQELGTVMKQGLPTISQTALDGYEKSVMPQPGDTMGVIAYKRANLIWKTVAALRAQTAGTPQQKTVRKAIITKLEGMSPTPAQIASAMKGQEIPSIEDSYIDNAIAEARGRAEEANAAASGNIQKKPQGALAPAADLKPYAYQQGQPLRPGATVNGMVYTGGNPKDKANWRKQ